MEWAAAAAPLEGLARLQLLPEPGPPAPQVHCVGTRGVPGGLRKVRSPHVTGQSHGRSSVTGAWAAGQILPDPSRGAPKCLRAGGQDQGLHLRTGALRAGDSPSRATLSLRRAGERAVHARASRQRSHGAGSGSDRRRLRPPQSEPPRPGLPVPVPPRGGRRAAQCGRGRAGPRDGPPSPLAQAAGPRRYPLVAALHHCCVMGQGAGLSARPAENFGET